jgi:hypothetical protein
LTMSDELIKRKTLFSFKRDGRLLPELCLDLMARQYESWPELRRGYASLGQVQVRELASDGIPFRLQFNPGRIVSTAAVVDGESVARRKCILCAENLPPSQAGILYRGEYLILCNPAPITPGHYTIAHIDHSPQVLAGAEGIFLLLAEDLGPGFIVLYNGARCGASIPEHLHFQAVAAGAMPLADSAQVRAGAIKIAETGGVSVCKAESLGRRFLIVEGRPLEAVGDILQQIMAEMRASQESSQEPMINLLCTSKDGNWVLVLFPRRRHRPDAYYREGEGRILVSPGAVDMGGLVIVPEERDFRRLDEETIKGIYREVSMEENAFARITNALSRGEAVPDAGRCRE